MGSSVAPFGAQALEPRSLFASDGFDLGGWHLMEARFDFGSVECSFAWYQSVPLAPEDESTFLVFIAKSAERVLDQLRDREVEVRNFRLDVSWQWQSGLPFYEPRLELTITP